MHYRQISQFNITFIIINNLWWKYGRTELHRVSLYEGSLTMDHNWVQLTYTDKPLDEQLQSDKRKLALGGKAVRAGMRTIYKSAGAQPATVYHRFQ